MINSYKKGSAVKLTENFNSSEFDCHCGKNCGNTLIDSNLVNYLQLIREHFGVPVSINSGYRDAEWNRAVGGASKSNHMLGLAADIVVKGVEPKEVAKYAESIGVKGIGVYKTFTHIDTRTNKYFWYDGGASNVSTFGETSIPSNPVVKPELTTTNKIEVSLPTLRKGAKNNYVKVAQALLDIEADGIFGAGTKAAVEVFQEKKDLEADGVIGAITWGTLF